MLKNKPHALLLTLLLLTASFSFAQTTAIDSLKRVVRAVRIDTARANAFNALADAFKEINPDSTVAYAQKAYRLSQKAGYDFGIAAAQMNEGNANVILSNYPKALQYFKKAQASYQSMLDKDSGIDTKQIKNGLARAYASCAVVESEENNYPDALENYFKALKLYQQIDNKVGVSKAYNNIGIVYKSQGKLAKALEYFNNALRIQRQTGEQIVAVTLTNIGAIHFELKHYKQAFDYYTQAENSFKKIDNKRGNALLQSYLGDYYAMQENPTKALEYYNRSLGLYDELQNKFGAALVYYNIGILHSKQKNFAVALPNAAKSLALAREIGVLDQTAQSEKLLSEIYGAMNNPAQSLVHYKAYVTVRDSLQNEETNRRFLRTEMNFEYEKREALIHEQNKRQQQLTLFIVFGLILLLAFVFLFYNRLQMKRRLTLQKEVAEYEQKALHLQMNPHFVFNCLGSISSFIVQNGTDSAIKYLSKFSKLMRLTLEYSKGSLIPIDKEIESLQNYLELEQLRFNRKFEFTILSTDAIEDDMALPPLLIQPFVENAILHGVVPKEGNGAISVRFDVVDNQLICTISDDGIGFNTSKALKENSVKAHQSMALEITRKRLEIIEATTAKKANVSISEIIQNNEVAGTKVTLLLPLQYIIT
jgi:tetratricopeptide (TPR) repeat protein